MTPDDRIESLENRLAALEKRRRSIRLLWITIAMLMPLGLWATTSLPHKFNDGDTLGASQLNANFTALAEATAPVGTIVAFAGSTAPSGWLLCDGTQVSRSTYATLYSVVANAYGSGDGTTSFHLPDLRGRFLRGVDGSAGVDPDKATRTAINAGGNTGNLVGSVQGHQFGSHRHPYSRGDSGGAVWCNDGATMGLQCLGTTRTITYTTGNGTNLIELEGGNETRPVNAYVNFIIKY